MAARWAGAFLAALVALPLPAFAAPQSFACSVEPGGKCNCGGAKDCRDLRKSGMCGTAMKCTILYGVYTCTCTAALKPGGGAVVTTPPKSKKLP